jgi:hypothetical protein
MRAYMAGILEITGMMSGQGFPLQSFMSHLSTHMAPKVGFPYPTLRKGDGNLVYVTEEGLRFFASRLTNSPIIKGQHVSRNEVIDMIRCIVAPIPPSGWEAFEVSLQEDGL